MSDPSTPPEDPTPDPAPEPTEEVETDDDGRPMTFKVPAANEGSGAFAVYDRVLGQYLADPGVVRGPGAKGKADKVARGKRHLVVNEV